LLDVAGRESLEILTRDAGVKLQGMQSIGFADRSLLTFRPNANHPD